MHRFLTITCGCYVLYGSKCVHFNQMYLCSLVRKCSHCSNSELYMYMYMYAVKYVVFIYMIKSTVTFVFSAGEASSKMSGTDTFPQTYENDYFWTVRCWRGYCLHTSSHKKVQEEWCSIYTGLCCRRGHF